MATGTAPTVAVMSPGDMGHAIGAVLRHAGLRVITALEGRSRRTAGLAAGAGIEDVGDLVTLVGEADVLLSVLPPARAQDLAGRVAAALREAGTTRTTGTAGRSLLYADLNAIAPQTARAIARLIGDAGARFVDAGIIGGPPRPGGAGPRIYASAEHAAELAALRDHGLDVRVIGTDVGQASGLKMCYAALTKGLTALGTELLVAGEKMGLSEALRAELQQSQQTLWTSLERSVPGMPPKAYRWVGEMEEIAATFGALGLTPRILEGAADLYRFVEHTPLGQETPETRQRGQTLVEVVDELAAALDGPG
ncbi:MAG: NAD(P)-dependent oxidoreductase [Chloroflexi bacterium]|nr:NAD(P)-dependent oxidoreductase [Chloroflexota bacterium]